MQRAKQDKGVSRVRMDSRRVAFKTCCIQDMLLGVRLLKVCACSSSGCVPAQAQRRLKASSRQAQWKLKRVTRWQLGASTRCWPKGLAAFVQLPGLTQVAGAVSMCAAAAALALASHAKASQLASHARALTLASHAKVPACRRASRLTSEVAQLRHSGGPG
jgi:hypothetical protein